MVNLRDRVADKYPNGQYAINSPAGIYKNLAIIAPSPTALKSSSCGNMLIIQRTSRSNTK